MSKISLVLQCSPQVKKNARNCFSYDVIMPVKLTLPTDSVYWLLVAFFSLVLTWSIFLISLELFLGAFFSLALAWRIEGYLN